MLNGKKVEITFGGGEPVPADKYTCLIKDVNLRMQKKYQSTEEEEVLNYEFEILDDKPMDESGDDGESTKGKMLYRRVSPKISTRSWLYKLIAAVLGPVEPSSLVDFNPDSLVGRQVKCLVTNQPNKDNTAVYSNIVEFLPVGKAVKTNAVAANSNVVSRSSRPAVADVAGVDDEITFDKPVARTPLPQEETVEDYEKAAEEAQRKLDELKARKAAKK